jgi:hypothetical protein
MREGTPLVLDYLEYKNKLRTQAWEERLWKLRGVGELPDPRDDEDRRRYARLLARLEQARSLAGELRGQRRSLRPEILRSAANS